MRHLNWTLQGVRICLVNMFLVVSWHKWNNSKRQTQAVWCEDGHARESYMSDRKLTLIFVTLDCGTVMAGARKGAALDRVEWGNFPAPGSVRTRQDHAAWPRLEISIRDPYLVFIPHHFELLLYLCQFGFTLFEFFCDLLHLFTLGLACLKQSMLNA